MRVCSRETFNDGCELNKHLNQAEAADISRQRSWQWIWPGGWQKSCVE